MCAHPNSVGEERLNGGAALPITSTSRRLAAAAGGTHTHTHTQHIAATMACRGGARRGGIGEKGGEPQHMAG